MKRFLTAILASVTLLVIPASASAAPIKECGVAGQATNVTARKFSCKQARGIARDYMANGAHMLHKTVRWVPTSYGGYEDVRLYDRGWVVRFQWGC